MQKKAELGGIDRGINRDLLLAEEEASAEWHLALGSVETKSFVMVKFLSRNYSFIYKWKYSMTRVLRSNRGLIFERYFLIGQGERK